MNKICRICQQEFEITNKFAGSRQFCYNCVPDGLDLGDRTKVKRQSTKKQALKLLGGKCLKCGESRPYLIDFHHVESEEKEHGFGRLLGDSKIEEYFKELEKAIPLCANCHREFHFQESENNLSIRDYVDLNNFSFHKEVVDRKYTTKEKEIKKEVIKEPQEVKKKEKIKEEKPKTWRELPITLISDKEYSFGTGDEAIEFLFNINSETPKNRISEGISRVIREQRQSYLGFKIKV